MEPPWSLSALSWSLGRLSPLLAWIKVTYFCWGPSFLFLPQPKLHLTKLMLIQWCCGHCLIVYIKIFYFINYNYWLKISLYMNYIPICIHIYTHTDFIYLWFSSIVSLLSLLIYIFSTNFRDYVYEGKNFFFNKKETLF